ncbi:amdS [Brettanomyces bruxellensis]|uniref:DEBR0S3_14686g1_1 n=1 Tax=Dekkera bruxellensis TaxID=5007 RepID=A0A7D9H4Z8_DEKBR|nr:amdS [Brettanomyces bruxellensis]
MPEWEDKKALKLHQRNTLLKAFEAPVDSIHSVDQQNDISDYLDHCELLSSEEKKITNSPIKLLLQQYINNNLTAEKAIRTYCHRATLAHQLVNCITEVRFEEAIEEAKKQDEYFKRNHELIGPLHGVAISLKDNIDIKGFDSTMGLIALACKPRKENAAIVNLIQKLGGIIICKTNTPAGLLFTETTNMLWGRTLNPYSRKYLNVGGSSGGEGAIAALKGSCFGIGSDIGGSVRHPAALNNVYSIKPSVGRIQTYGTQSGQPGQESIKTVYGILSHYLDNMTYSFKVFIEAEPYKDIDAGCIPLSYRKYTLEKHQPLNIAFLDRDGLTSVTPPLIRGLNIVKRKLKAAGHNVFDWNDAYFKSMTDCMYPMYGANGLTTLKELLKQSGEPIDSRMQKSIAGAKVMPVSRLWNYQIQRTKIVQQYLNYWNTGSSNGRLDAIIIPTSAFPACLLNKVPPQPYTSMWNALDYSASTLPVTRCNVKIDRPVKKDSYLSDVDRDVHDTYRENLIKFEGGPVSVQVVCNRLEEEKCLAITKYISSLLD